MAILTGVVLHGGAGAADGFWQVANEAGRWRAVDPAGRSTAILGVDHVQWYGMVCQPLGGRHLYHEHNLTNYPSKAEWESETIGRLKSWGFNSLGAGCDEALSGRGLATFRYLRVSDEFCRGDRERYLCEYRFAPCTAFPNVFGEAFPAHCEEVARKMCAAARDDAQVLGYFIDNELAWNGGGRGPTGLFEVVDGLDAAHSAKRALEAFLSARVQGGRSAFAALAAAARERVKLEFVRLAAEARSGDATALHFAFWRDGKGAQHPDARFGWDGPRPFGPREELRLAETMGLRLRVSVGFSPATGKVGY